MSLVNIFYRAQLLEDAEEAVSKCPALTLNREHASLVLFSRESSNNNPSLILAKDWGAMTALIVEVMEGFIHSKFGKAAVDSFGDSYNWEELYELLCRSDYAALKSIDGRPYYEVVGSLGKVDFFDVLKRYNEQQDAEAKKVRNRAKAAALQENAGLLLSMTLLLVEAGFDSVESLHGLTPDTLTKSGYFSLDEANELITELTERKLI